MPNASATAVAALSFAQAKIDQFAPNAQRQFGPAMLAQVQAMEADAKRHGFASLEAHLQAEQWDGLEQWFNISFPETERLIRFNGARHE